VKGMADRFKKIWKSNVFSSAIEVCKFLNEEELSPAEVMIKVAFDESDCEVHWVYYYN